MSHDHLPFVQKRKKGVSHLKKVLNLGDTTKNKLALEDNLRFFEWEEEETKEEEMEEGTHTSSKGQLDRSQPNDQTIESPLKKFKKKNKKYQLLRGFLVLPRQGLHRWK